MALKLTRTASETLNDIILNTLQEQGIEKAEALEESIFSQFNELRTASDEKHSNSIEFTVVGGSYAIIHQQVQNDQVVLLIVHPSRLPAGSNS